MEPTLNDRRSGEGSGFARLRSSSGRTESSASMTAFVGFGGKLMMNGRFSD